MATQPDRIDRYAVKKLLGNGGMARVYLAVDPTTGWEIAIKILRRKFLYEKQVHERFRREARAMARMEHSAIVPVYAYGNWQGRPYLIMRYMSGGTLGERVAQEPMKVEETLPILDRLASALDMAHQNQIIHRDVKPQNVLFDGENHAYLADFGLAREIEDSGLLTGSGLIGTPTYMAPEISQKLQLSPSMDVYALGITLFEMLAGEPPYKGQTPMGTMLAHSTEPIPNITQKVPSLPPPVSKVLECALAKQPGARYHSAGDLAADFRLAVANEPLMFTPKFSDTPVVPLSLSESSASDLDPRLKMLRRSKTQQWKPVQWISLGLLVVFSLVMGFGLTSLSQRGRAGQLSATVPVSSVPSTEGASAFAVLPATLASDQTLLPDAVARFGYGSIQATAQSEDGKLLAVASSIGLYLYSATTLQSSWFFPSEFAASKVTFSPDSRLLAAAFRDGSVRILEVSGGQLIHTWDNQVSAISSLAWSPSGELVAGGMGDGTITLWRAEDGTILHSQRLHTDRVSTLAWTAEGDRLVSASLDGFLVVWDVSSPTSINPSMTLVGHQAGVFAAAWSPGGSQLASGANDGVIILWDLGTGKPAQTLNIGVGIRQLRWSPAEMRLAAGLTDGSVILWDTLTLQLMQQFNGHGNSILGLAFSPDGKTLTSAGRDNIVKWDLVTYEQIVDFKQFGGPLFSAVPDPHGEFIVSGGSDGNVTIHSMATGEAIRKLFEHKVDISAVALSPDGSVLASASVDRTIILWDPDTGEYLFKLEHLNTGVNRIAFSPDGALLAGGSAEGNIILWDGRSGEWVRTMPGHAGSITGLAWSPDGSKVVSSSTDKTLIIWDVLEGYRLATLGGQNGEFRSVAWSPDGRRIAAGSSLNMIVLWNAETGQEIDILEGHTSSVDSLTWSSEGSWLASGSAARRIILWNMETSQPEVSFMGHTGAITSLAFIQDNNVLLSSSDDGTILFWQLPRPDRDPG